jgi:hypothetical protein
MKRADAILEESIGQYKDILEKMYHIQTAVKSSNPEDIKGLSVAIDTAQEKTQKIEQELDLLLQQTPELRNSPIFHERLALVGQILDMTEKCTPKIKVMMAIKRDELKKIAGGMAVMNTYSSTSNCQPKGRLINRSG